MKIPNIKDKRVQITSAVIIAAIITLTVIYMLKDGQAIPNQASLYTVERGDLKISVTENGDIKALNSVDIKSEVAGGAKILNIVDEGTIIEPEDVNKMVLVELDASDIKEKLLQQEISFSAAEASRINANASYDIQIKDNESNIKKAQMDMSFAMMDFQKYLGAKIADKVLKDKEAGIAADFRKLIDDPNLSDSNLGEGDASQRLIKLTNDIKLSSEEYARAADQLGWSEKLFAEKFIAETELKTDMLKTQRLEVAMKSSEVDLDLFKVYEFPKTAEELISKYEESIRELERERASAEAKLAQADSKRKSEEAKYAFEKEKKEKLERSLKACIIKSPAPGQVIYASSTDERRRRERPIQVGTLIYEKEDIIKIPNTAETKVEISIHETWIDRIDINQPAVIKISAFPDREFTGKVLWKAPLAESGNWWMMANEKVYKTNIGINGRYDFLKTGMSAKVEILINELKDVLSVPIQSVINVEGKKICYISKGSKTEMREVETGLFNDNHVEIKKGLEEGDKVLLNPPRPAEKTRPKTNGNKPKINSEKPKTDGEMPKLNDEKTNFEDQKPKESGRRGKRAR
jgi:HlyD family secretion protein